MLSSPSTAASAPVVATEEELLRTAPLPHERVVYWGSGSPQAWRVLIALEEKRVPYRSVCVSFSSGVLKTPFFRSLNPRMRVPVLVEPVDDSSTTDHVATGPKAHEPIVSISTTSRNGNSNAPPPVGLPSEVAALSHGIAHLLSLPRGRVVVYESTAILEFLERKFAAPALMPLSLAQYAKAQSRMHEANEILSVVGDLVVFLRRVPLAQRSAAVVATKWATLDAELALWEAYLGNSQRFLVDGDDAPTLCDFVLFTNVAYAVRCGLQLDGFYPKLAAFYAALCARASIAATWPPHWRSSPGSRVLAKCQRCADRNECACDGDGATVAAAPTSESSSVRSVSPPESQS